MALRFQPPNLPPVKSKGEIISEGAQGLSNVVTQWRDYKLKKAQQEMAMAQTQQQMDLLKRTTQAEYGTGAPAPMQAGVITPTAPQVGPEEQMFGFDATMPTVAPETPEELQQRIGNKGLNARADWAKALGGGHDGSGELQQARTDYYRALAGDIPERQDERGYKQRERRNTERSSIVDKFNADPSVKKSQQMIDGASTIEGLALSDNPIAAGAIPTFMARASGEVGNLSEADKAPFGGSRAILARLEAAVTQAATGRLTEDNRQFIIGLSGIMKKRGQSNMNELAKTRSKQYSKSSDFLSEDDIFSTLIPDLGSQAPGDTGGRKATHRWNPETGKVEPIQ